MIRLFKFSTFGQVIVIILTALLLWVRAFIHPVEPQLSEMFAPLYEVVYGWLSEMPRLASALALIMIIVEGVWLNLMLYNNKLIGANNLIPTFLYLIAMSWGYTQLTITPVLFVNLCILATIKQLFSHSNMTLDVERNFNASFLIGLASLFYLPAIVYIIPFIFVFVLYKLYRWRHIAVSITGFIAPSIILLTYAFLSDKLQYYLYLIGHDIASVHVVWQQCPTWTTIFNILYIAMLTIMTLKVLASSGDKVMNQRINTGILTLPILACIAILFYMKLFPVDTQASAIVFAFVASSFFLADRKRKWIGEVVLWILVLCSIINVWIG